MICHVLMWTRQAPEQLCRQSCATWSRAAGHTGVSGVSGIVLVWVGRPCSLLSFPPHWQVHSRSAFSILRHWNQPSPALSCSSPSSFQNTASPFRGDFKWGWSVLVVNIMMYVHIYIIQKKTYFFWSPSANGNDFEIYQKSSSPS